MVKDMSVSFVLPMFNERENIEKTVDTLMSLAGELAREYEIVIVDDASTDGGDRVVEDAARREERIKFHRLEKNTRFGGAFARGFKEAGKDIILYMDSDLPVSVQDIKVSFELIRGADIVHGYSKVKKGDTLRRKFISGVYNFMVRTLFGLDIKDINSGYKIVRRSAVNGIDFISRSPFVDVELFLHARKNNCRIRQFPLVFNPREGGRSYIARLPVIWATFSDMIRVRMRYFTAKQ